MASAGCVGSIKVSLSIYVCMCISCVYVFVYVCNHICIRIFMCVLYIIMILFVYNETMTITTIYRPVLKCLDEPNMHHYLSLSFITYIIVSYFIIYLSCLI